MKNGGKNKSVAFIILFSVFKYVDRGMYSLVNHYLTKGMQIAKQWQWLISFIMILKLNAFVFSWIAVYLYEASYGFVQWTATETFTVFQTPLWCSFPSLSKKAAKVASFKESLIVLMTS